MNKSIILIQILLFLSIIILSTVCYSQTDSNSNNIKTEKSNYMIARYVIGSGGVHAGNSNNFLMATAGETVVGGASNSNYLLNSGFWSPAFDLPTAISQSDIIDIPTSFTIYQNYPNPFNPQTAIKYDLPSECFVTVEIFNVIGQRIKLISSQIQGPGSFQIEWYGIDDHGKIVESGIYFYRITARKNEVEQSGADIIFQQIKKMLLVK